MRVDIRGTDDLRKFAKDLRKHGDAKVLRRKFIKETRTAITPTQREIKAAYRGLSSKSGERSASRRAKPGLRASLAKATTIQIRLSGKQAGVRLRVDGRKMPEGMGSLPRYIEGTGRRWRHQVYGNPEVWVNQDPHSVFYPRVSKARFVMRRRIERIGNDLARELSR